MSWASRRRTAYIASIALAFGIPLIIFAGIWLYEEPSCSDGIQNQGETSPDRGGPCQLLDESTLVPHALMWSRSVPVRDGLYNAVAYIENPNTRAGVRSAAYIFRIYDSENILIAEREGESPIMPGSITPIMEPSIDTGNREVARTFFEFTEPLVWERGRNGIEQISVSNTRVDHERGRVTARVTNEDVAPIEDVVFIAVLFNTAGNAFAASQTSIPDLDGGQSQEVVFTWSGALSSRVARVDIIPVREPVVE